MRKLSEENISAIHTLAKTGFSLNSIARETNVKKTTAYYYFKQVRGMTYSKPIISFESKEELGEVLGIFAGDGSLTFSLPGYHYIVKVHLGKDLEYTRFVRSLFEKCFGKKFRIAGEVATQLVVISESKDIYGFFLKNLKCNPPEKALTIRLPRKRYSRRFRIGFLRGFVDTDGTVCRCKTGLAVSFYTSSKRMAKQIKAFLDSLQFQDSLYEIRRGNDNPRYQVRLFSRDIPRFLSLIKPRNTNI